MIIARMLMKTDTITTGIRIKSSVHHTISRFRNRVTKNIGQVSHLPILLFVCVVIWQPCKHRHSESINENQQYDLQGARTTITTNILNVSKLTEIQFLTKKHTIFAPFIQSPDLFDDFLLVPVTIFLQTMILCIAQIYKLEIAHWVISFRQVGLQAKAKV